MSEFGCCFNKNCTEIFVLGGTNNHDQCVDCIYTINIKTKKCIKYKTKTIYKGGCWAKLIYFQGEKIVYGWMRNETDKVHLNVPVYLILIMSTYYGDYEMLHWFNASLTCHFKIDVQQLKC